MANFCTPRVRPAEVPSCKVFNSSLFVVDGSGSYETDFILPSSSPVRNRGILCGRDVTPARLNKHASHHLRGRLSRHYGRAHQGAGKAQGIDRELDKGENPLRGQFAGLSAPVLV
jgi:hypothetical protein